MACNIERNDKGLVTQVTVSPIKLTKKLIDPSIVAILNRNRNTMATVLENKVQLLRLPKDSEDGRELSGEIAIEASILAASSENQQEVLKAYAIEEGHMVEDYDSRYGDRVSAGEESIVYRDPNRPGVVTKVNNLKMHASPLEFFDRIAIHNSLFSESPIKVVGFTIPRGNKGNIAVIVEQPFIEGRKASKQEVDTHLEKLGFTEINETFVSDEYVLDDVYNNAVVTEDGSVVIIDEVASLNTESEGFGGTQEYGMIVDLNDPEAAHFITNRYSRNIFQRVVKNIAERLGLTTEEYARRLSVITTNRSVKQTVNQVLFGSLNARLFNDHTGSEVVSESDILYQSKEEIARIEDIVPELQGDVAPMLTRALGQSTKFQKIMDNTKAEPNVELRQELNQVSRELGQFFRNKQGNTPEAQELKRRSEELKQEIKESEKITKTLTLEESQKIIEEELDDLIKEIETTDKYLLQSLSENWLATQLEYAKADRNMMEAQYYQEALSDIGGPVYNDIIRQLQDQQRNSLKRGLSYLKASTDYSSDFKYLVLKEIVTYNINNEGYVARRTAETVALHNDMAPAVLSEVYRDLRDDPTANIIKTYATHKNKAFLSHEARKEIAERYIVEKRPNGYWIKFPMGGTEQVKSDLYQMARESNQHPAAWCTGGSLSTATTHNNSGDFYMFVDSEFNPKIAMLYDSTNKISESRGLGEGQAVLPEHLSEQKYFFDTYEGGEHYRDTWLFNDFHARIVENGEKLAVEELDDFWRVHKKGDGSYDRETSDLKKKQLLDAFDNDSQHIIDALSEKYGIDESQITKGDNYNSNSVIHFGDIKDTKLSLLGKDRGKTRDLSLSKLKVVYGSIDVNSQEWTNFDHTKVTTKADLSSLELVYGDLIINTYITELNSLKEVTGHLSITDSQVSLDNLEKVGLSFAMRNVRGGDALKLGTIGQFANFSNWNGNVPKLTKVDGGMMVDDWTGEAPTLETVGEGLDIVYYNGALPSLKTVNGHLSTKNRTQGFPKLEHVGRTAKFIGMKGDVPLLKTIGRDADFESWEGNAPLLETIGGEAMFYDWKGNALNLREIKGAAVFDTYQGEVPSLTRIGGDAYIQHYKGVLESLRYVGGELYIPQGEVGLPALEEVKGSVTFSGWKNDAPKLKRIDGSAYFTQWEGKAPLLETIGESADFTEWAGDATSLESIGRNAKFTYWKGKAPLLRSIGATATFTEWTQNAPSLETIGSNAVFSGWKGNAPALGVIVGDADFIGWVGNAPVLEIIGGKAMFLGWEHDAPSLQEIGGHAAFPMWEGQAPVLEHIGGSAILSNQYNNSLPRLKKIGRHADFGNWTGSVPMLQEVGGELRATDWQGTAPMLQVVGEKWNGEDLWIEKAPNIKKIDGQRVQEGEIEIQENDILFQDERGALIRGTTKSVMILSKYADTTTPLHEIAHEYERVLSETEKATIMEWAGHSEWGRNTSEAFAKGFEKYLYEGVARDTGIENIFQKFAEYLKGVIKDAIRYFQDINELNQEMIDIYDLMVQQDGLLTEQDTTTTTRSEFRNSQDYQEYLSVEEDLNRYLKEQSFGILTAENPNAMQMSAAENSIRNRALEVWLDEQGYIYSPVEGHYGQPESSYIVHGLTPADAILIARQFQQESVMHNEGLFYQDGSYNPRVIEDDSFDQSATDFFSKINGNKFSLGLDFDTRLNNETSEDIRFKTDVSMLQQAERQHMEELVEHGVLMPEIVFDEAGELDIQSLQDRAPSETKDRAVALDPRLFDGVPGAFAITDELTTGESLPLDKKGATVGDLQGGIGFALLLANMDLYWANVTEAHSKTQVARAMAIYEANKEYFNKVIWKDGIVPYGHIPVYIVRMSNTAIHSNEAMARAALSMLESNDAFNAMNPAELLEAYYQTFETVKESYRASANNESNTAQTRKQARGKLNGIIEIENLLKNNNLNSIQDILNFVTGTEGRDNVGIGQRLVILDPIFNSKSTLRTLMAKQGFKERLNKNSVSQKLVDPAYKTDQGVGQVLGVSSIQIFDLLGDGVEETNHPNYKYGAKGQFLGYFAKNLHVGEVFSTIRGNIVNHLYHRFAKGTKKAASLSAAISDGAPTQSGLSGLSLLGAQYQTKMDNVDILAGYLRQTFPGVNFVMTQRAFDIAVERPEVKKLIGKDMQVQGFTDGKTVFINPKFKSEGVVLHEFGHIWVSQLKNNPKTNPLWKRGVELAKQTESYKQAIENGVREEIATEEILVEMITNRGENLFKASTENKTKFEQWLYDVVETVRTMFKSTKYLMSNFKIENITIDQFVEAALHDMLSGRFTDTTTGIYTTQGVEAYKDFYQKDPRSRGNNPNIEVAGEATAIRFSQINKTETLTDTQSDMLVEVYKSMGFDQVLQEDLQYTTEDGDICASAGLTTGIQGSNWTLVSDFKGYPSHRNGGVDITLGADGVYLTNERTTFKAQSGLVTVPPLFEELKSYNPEYSVSRLTPEELEVVQSEKSNESLVENPEGRGYERFILNYEFDETDFVKLQQKYTETEEFRTKTDMRFSQIHKLSGGACVAGAFNCNTEFVAETLKAKPLRTIFQELVPNIKESPLSIPSRAEAGKGNYEHNTSIDSWEIFNIAEANPDKFDIYFKVKPDAEEYRMHRIIAEGSHDKQQRRISKMNYLKEAGITENDLKKLPIGTLVMQRNASADVDGQGYWIPKEYGFVPSHTATIVGYEDDGTPLVYDLGQYKRITDTFSSINGIIIPKEYEQYTFDYITSKSADYQKDMGVNDPIEASTAKNKRANIIIDNIRADYDEVNMQYGIPRAIGDKLASRVVGIAGHESRLGTGMTKEELKAVSNELGRDVTLSSIAGFSGRDYKINHIDNTEWGNKVVKPTVKQLQNDYQDSPAKAAINVTKKIVDSVPLPAFQMASKALKATDSIVEKIFPSRKESGEAKVEYSNVWEQPKAGWEHELDAFHMYQDLGYKGEELREKINTYLKGANVQNNSVTERYNRGINFESSVGPLSIKVLPNTAEGKGVTRDDLIQKDHEKGLAVAGPMAYDILVESFMNLRNQYPYLNTDELIDLATVSYNNRSKVDSRDYVHSYIRDSGGILSDDYLESVKAFENVLTR